MKFLKSFFFVAIVVFSYNYFKETKVLSPAKTGKKLLSNSSNKNVTVKQTENQQSRIVASTSTAANSKEFIFDEKNIITNLTKSNFKKELFFCKAKISDCEFFPNVEDHGGRSHKLKFCHYYASSKLGKKDYVNYCDNLYYKDPMLQEIKKAYADTYKEDIRTCFTLQSLCDSKFHSYPITDEEAEQLSVLEFNGSVKYLF